MTRNKKEKRKSQKATKMYLSIVLVIKILHVMHVLCMLYISILRRLTLNWRFLLDQEIDNIVLHLFELSDPHTNKAYFLRGELLRDYFFIKRLVCES